MRYGLRTSVAAILLPITVAQAKAHSRILGRDSEDAEIEEIIKEAASFLETETNLTLCPTTYVMTLDRFPSYYGTRLYPYDFVNSAFSLPLNPVIGVSSVSYTDVEGNAVVLNPSTYQVASARWPARVMPNTTNVWPFTNYLRMDSVSVTFTAGYTSVGLIPPAYKRAVKYLFAHFYENREALSATAGEPAKLPYALGAMITQMRYMGFAQS